MADSDVPQLVDKKRGVYSVVAPKLEAGKFSKWKRRMLCYLTGMEPYYITCINDGPFVSMTTQGCPNLKHNGLLMRGGWSIRTNA